MIRISTLAFAGAASLVLAALQPIQAHAATYVYTGKLTSGLDGRGLFGAAGGDLTGALFTATFVRDDALALPGDIFLGPDSSEIHGEGVHAPLSATLAINGQTVQIAGGTGDQQQTDDGHAESFQMEATTEFSRIALGAFLREDAERTVDFGPDYHHLPNISFQADPGFEWFGDFSFFAVDPLHPGETTGAFDGRSIRLVVDGSGGNGGAGGVPEPASWALMLVGFGGLGAMLRRRRAAGLATA